MKARPNLHVLILAFALILVALGARSSPPVTDLSAVEAAGQGPIYLNCTVRAVDGKTRTLEVIAGVGHALRLYSMKVAPACQIEVAGEVADLGSLKRGTVVRIRYMSLPAGPSTAARRMATAIETLRSEDNAGAR